MDFAVVQQAGPSESNLAELEKVFAPLRSTLTEQQYLCGQEPSYADFVAASAFAVCLHTLPVFAYNTV